MSADKLTKAKVQLILNQPFFALLSLSMKYVEDASIQTACTDGQQIRYNPQFVESLEVDEIKGLIAHEIMHIAMLHHTRRQGRDGKKWNVAADYAINQILIDAGFTLPKDGLISPAFANMSAEEIYSKLPDNPNNGGNQGQGNGQGSGQDQNGFGGVEDAPANTEAERNQIEAETKQMVSQAAMAAKQQGKLPAHLERLIEDIMQPIVNWKDVLSVFLTEKTKNDYTFRMPNKRFISQGLYLPSLESIEKGKFCLLVDTSGSIDNELLNQFAGEMQSILSDSANSLSVLFIDTEVNHVQEFEEDETIDLHPKGGGGTDFKPGFDYIEKNSIDAKAIVYFTDGYCDSMPDNSEVPTLWACYNNKNFNPKFGEVIHINGNN